MEHNKNYADQVSPEQVVKICAEHGQTIRIVEAEKIIEFMYMLTEIAFGMAELELKKNNRVVRILMGSRRILSRILLHSS